MNSDLLVLRRGWLTPRKKEGNTARRGMTWPDPEGQEILEEAGAAPERADGVGRGRRRPVQHASVQAGVRGIAHATGFGL